MLVNVNLIHVKYLFLLLKLDRLSLGTIDRLAIQFLNYVGEVCTLDSDETKPHCCHQMVAITSGK